MFYTPPFYILAGRLSNGELVAYVFPLLLNPTPVEPGCLLRRELSHWIHIGTQGLAGKITCYLCRSPHAFLRALVNEHIPDYRETASCDDCAPK